MGWKKRWRRKCETYKSSCQDRTFFTFSFFIVFSPIDWRVEHSTKPRMGSNKTKKERKWNSQVCFGFVPRFNILPYLFWLSLYCFLPSFSHLSQYAFFSVQFFQHSKLLLSYCIYFSHSSSHKLFRFHTKRKYKMSQLMFHCSIAHAHERVVFIICEKRAICEILNCRQ